MLAGIETMLRHRDILQGVSFKWLTDHKGLTYLLNQKNVSGRQARWLEKISSFVFEVVYVPGSENVVADALSRLYSDDAPGTERAGSEYTYHDVDGDDTGLSLEMPMLAGMEAVVATRRSMRTRKPTSKVGEGQRSGDDTETAKDFAKRMKDKFILRGPRERTEGENNSTNATSDKDNSANELWDDRSIDDHMPEGNDDHLPKIVVPEIEATDDVENAETGNELTDVVLNSSTSIQPV